MYFKEFWDVVEENFINFVSEFRSRSMFVKGAREPIIYNNNSKSRNWMDQNN